MIEILQFLNRLGQNQYGVFYSLVLLYVMVLNLRICSFQNVVFGFTIIIIQSEDFYIENFIANLVFNPFLLLNWSTFLFWIEYFFVCLPFHLRRVGRKLVLYYM